MAKWYNPLTWGQTNKGFVPIPKLFGQIHMNLFGETQTYNDDFRTYIKEGYEKNDVVRAIVDKIAGSVGQAKWYLKDRRTGEKVYIKHFELMKQNAAPMRTLSEVFMDGTVQKLLTGNAYYVGEKGTGINQKYYDNIYVVPSSNMEIKGNQRGIHSYRPNEVTGFSGSIPASDVVHIKTSNPSYQSDNSQAWLYGQPPLKAAKESIRTYNDSKLAGLYFLQNKGAQKALMLDEEATLTPEGEDMLKQQIRQRGQGNKNNANIPILEGVKGVIDLSADPKKALIIEQRLQAAQEICNVFNFPSQLIGLMNTTYQNAKEAKKAYWESCVIPELDEIAAGLNRMFIKQYGNNVILCYDLAHIDALQEDKLLRGQAITAFAGLATINQALEMAGLPTYDWMKTPTTMEEYQEQLYHGFSQIAITDSEEVSDQNGETNENEETETGDSEG